jgi:hypothetical protein
MNVSRHKPELPPSIQPSGMSLLLHRLRRSVVSVAVLAAAAVLAVLPATPLLAQGSQPEALAALRAAVDSEMQASRTDKSNWMYRDEDDTP